MFGFGGEYRRLVFWSKLAFGAAPRVYEDAVGGNFEGVGRGMAALLEAQGLKEGDQLVDVGCGAGRLAVQLKDWPRLRYAGFDVVEDLLVHARAIVQRPDWRFELLTAPVLPLADESADMCCYFSVFTHLKPPLIAAYLRESQRVLRPGGKVVFSFLDPGVGAHRRLVEPNPVKRIVARLIYPLNIGFTPQEVAAWAPAAGLHVAHVESPHPLGQSVAVFEKRPPGRAT